MKSMTRKNENYLGSIFFPFIIVRSCRPLIHIKRSLIFIKDIVYFVGPLIPLFWTSGDVVLKVQRQGVFCLLVGSTAAQSLPICFFPSSSGNRTCVTVRQTGDIVYEYFLHRKTGKKTWPIGDVEKMTPDSRRCSTYI